MSAVLKVVQKPKVRTVSVETSTYVSVDVDVPLSEISTEDLLDELAERPGSPNPSLLKMYEALALGRKDETLELLRAYLQSALGRILP